MTTYSKLTDFASKDALLTGNPAKIVKGVEIDDEFNAIATADATSVKGPVSATVDNTVARWDGTTGRAVQGSGVTISDANVVTASGFAGPLNGTVGATTPNTGAFTTLGASGTLGVGITSPAYKAHIYDVADTGLQVTKGGSGASRFKVVSGKAVIGYDGSNGDTEVLGISSTGLAVTGALSATGVNGVFGASVNATSGKLRTSGYIDATRGALLDSINAAENAYLPLTLNGSTLLLQTSGTTQATLDTSGNFGLGVTPSGWSNFKAIDVGARLALAGTNNRAQLSYNSYWNGSNYIYKATDAASAYDQVGGVHSWSIAPSGTAGNAITFTQAMTLDASSNLSVTGSVRIGSYTTATRPSHAAGKVIYVSDGAAGAKYQGSDGSSWVNLG